MKNHAGQQLHINVGTRDLLRGSDWTFVSHATLMIEINSVKFVVDRFNEYYRYSLFSERLGMETVFHILNKYSARHTM